MTEITDDLKMVLPIKEHRGVTIHAYHQPISRAVFEANYRLIAGTRSALVGKGVAYMMDSGPRIAALTLKDEGRRDATEFGEKGNGGADSLLAEIKRLTTILAPSQHGWDVIPVDAAISQGILDEEDWADAVSALVFFTCMYAMAKKVERQRVAKTTASTLNASITSSSATEFAGSLPTLTKAAFSDPKAASSVPS